MKSYGSVLSSTFRICAVLLCVAALGAAATLQAKPVQNSFYAATEEQRQSAPGTLLKIVQIKPPAFYRAKAWKILYNTRDVFGRPILSSGVVVLSDYAPTDPSQRKIVAWAHPTTGIGRNCAPSLQGWPGSSILGLKEFVSAGYVVVATDYPGLGTIGPVGYLVGRGQGQAVLDSIRAAQKIPGISNRNDVILWGYSQGGHAVQFASHLAQSYAPELKIKGMAAVAPPTDLARLFATGSGTMEGRILTSYVLKSWSLKFGADLSAMVDRSARGWVNVVSEACINNLDGEIKAFEAQGKLKEAFLVADPLQTSPWRELIRDNSLRGFTAAMPNLVFQGSKDGVVRPDVTAVSVRNACRSGAAVKFVVLPGEGHSSSAKASVSQAVSWMQDRFAGRKAPSNCK
jgi:alpha-beta hydrolase superfamily lysophospholipase